MRRWRTLPLVLLLLPLLVAAAPGRAAPGRLPPGARVLEVRHLAPGVDYVRFTLGRPSGADHWTVSVAFTAGRDAAADVAARLRAAGFDPRIERVDQRAQDDPRHGPLGFLVRVGAFTSQADAQALADELVAAGFADARADFTGEDGRPTTGPWVVHVLAIDPVRFHGRVEPALATGVVPGREPVTRIDARTGALAGVNGGYFVIGPEDGTPGDLAGISVVHGNLVSEAVNGRTSLVVPVRAGGRARVAALRTSLSASASDGAARLVDGRNRTPGLVRSCGGVGGDIPTERPKHDFTCTDPAELIQFTPAFGATTEPGPGVEAVLDGSGRVRAVREPRGGAIPPAGSVLAGTGDGADWLRAHARPGARIRVAVRILADGAPLAAGAPLGVVNGGPRLLRHGAVDIPAYAEGFVWPEDPEFYFRFGVRRNPRTLAGVTRDGRLLLVAVDGHAPGYSVGASFAESAALLRALGATEAVNLDGGGSTTMAIGSRLVNRPSDATGERPVGDALVLRAG
jgi:Phosphodiester glycosidase/SPOR domain